MQEIKQSTKYKEQYDEVGAIFPIPVLSLIQLQRYTAKVEALEAMHNGIVPRAGWCHAYFDWAFELVTTPAILNVIEQIIGSEIIVQGTLLLNKYPFSEAYVPWHQDGIYSNLPSSVSTSAWVALSESKIENGCMRVVPGSHKRNHLVHQEISDENSLFKNGGKILEEINEDTALDLILNPGEMSIHHNSIIHGSLPNNSAIKRTGLVIRYSTPAYQGETPVIRARGNANCDHLNIIDQPLFPPGEKRFEEHRKFLEQRGEILGFN